MFFSNVLFLSDKLIFGTEQLFKTFAIQLENYSNFAFKSEDV
jgi:hypothetical protein